MTYTITNATGRPTFRTDRKANAFRLAGLLGGQVTTVLFGTVQVVEA